KIGGNSLVNLPVPCQRAVAVHRGVLQYTVAKSFVSGRRSDMKLIRGAVSKFIYAGKPCLAPVMRKHGKTNSDVIGVVSGKIKPAEHRVLRRSAMIVNPHRQ